MTELKFNGILLIVDALMLSKRLIEVGCRNMSLGMKLKRSNKIG